MLDINFSEIKWWTTIEEEILDRDPKKITLDEEMGEVLITQMLLIMEMLILIETGQWITHIMWKKLWSNFNN